MDLLIDTVKRLKQGQKVNVPVYDFTTHSRLPDEVVMYGANVIIFEVRHKPGSNMPGEGFGGWGHEP